jgi:uncharacterized membrane protein (UPF0127 family)
LSLALPVCAACQRTPEEPAPATTVTLVAPPRASTPTLVAQSAGPAVSVPPASSDGPSLAGRCVLATPKDPPPTVAPGPAPGCPRDPEPAQQRLPIVSLRFPDAAGVAIDAELVSSEHDVERGLMYRKQMADDRGMLFRLNRTEHVFWMHNTCIPLDMLFVDDDGLVVGIVENVPTLNDAHRTVGCPSSWVLETNAGWSRKHGVKAGQRVAIPSEARSL